MSFEIVFVLLFSVATAVALLAKRINVPYTVALVVAGLIMGAIGSVTAPALTKALLYAVFLPGLLFEAAFHLNFDKFWKNKLSVTSLAIPGLAVAIGLTAIILAPIANALVSDQEFTILHGLVFASLIAATDPIAVVALFKSLGAPKRLTILVEGESLINDGTAVVIFTLMVAAATGAELTIGGAIASFLWVAGAGLFVGVVFGFFVSWVTHKIDDPMIEITLTTIAAYGAFAVAEHFHVSGVIATVVAGMLCGNYGARSGMSPSTKVAVLSFWEYWAFALNSIVFLLIGLEVDLALLTASWKAITLAFLAVLLARTVVVYSASSLIRLTREKFPWKWSAILTWGGLRGSLSMVLVLALPADFPHRALLINMTFGVVLLSILGQGLTIGPLLRALGIVTSDRHHEYEVIRGDLHAAHAAIEEIDRMQNNRSIPADVLAELKEQYMTRVSQSEAAISALHMEQDQLQSQERLAASRHLLLLEKDALMESQHDGLISKEAFEELLNQVDARLVALESHDSEPSS